MRYASLPSGTCISDDVSMRLSPPPYVQQGGGGEAVVPSPPPSSFLICPPSPVETIAKEEQGECMEK